MKRSNGTAASVVLSWFIALSVLLQVVVKLASLELKHLLCSRLTKLYEEPLPATPATPPCARTALDGCTEAVLPRPPNFSEVLEQRAYTTPEITSDWMFDCIDTWSTSATDHEGSYTMDTLQRYGSRRGAADNAVRSCLVS
jgi:hypothetical protein